MVPPLADNVGLPVYFALIMVSAIVLHELAHLAVATYYDIAISVGIFVPRGIRKKVMKTRISVLYDSDGPEVAIRRSGMAPLYLSLPGLVAIYADSTFWIITLGMAILFWFLSDLPSILGIFSTGGIERDSPEWFEIYALPEHR